MPEPYKALRVPISLLQQKVYSTARRLPKLTRWTPPEEKKPTTAIIAIGSKYKAFGKPQESYLRRFFFSVSEFGEDLVCRGCGRRTHNLMQRSDHVSCYPMINQVLARLLEIGKCAICERTIDKVEAGTKFNAVPICSEACLHFWDGLNPEDFTVTHAEIVKEGLTRRHVK